MTFEIEHSCFILGFLIVLYLLTRKVKFNRHRHNQKKAKLVLKIIRGFEGANVSSRVFSYLRKVDPFVFEELILTVFTENGYKAIRNKRYTGDGGIDGKLINKDKQLILIQVKRYSGYIQKAHVIEFSKLVRFNKKATLGYFIHTGRTGRGVYSELTNLKLISGARLITLLLKK